MSAVFRVSAIVTAAGLALAGCGQTGALYLPTIPPMPKPLAPESSGASALAPASASNAPAATQSH